MPPLQRPQLGSGGPAGGNNVGAALGGAANSPVFEAFPTPLFQAVRSAIAIGFSIFNYFKDAKEKKKKKKAARIKAAREQEERERKILEVNQTSFSSITLDLPLGEEVDQRIIIGENIVNGVTVLSGVSGPYLVRMFVLACHEIEDFVEMSLNGNTLQIGRDGYVYNEPYLKRAGTAANEKIEFETRRISFGKNPRTGQTEFGTTSVLKPLSDRERKYLRISTRYGALPGSPQSYGSLNVTDSILKQRFDIPGIFQLLGHATVTMEQFRGAYLQATEDELKTENANILREALINEANEVWGGGIGSPRFRIRGLKVWDPRDASQRKDNENTWKYSNNAALVIPTLMQMRQFTNNQISFDNFHIQSIIDSANICDQYIQKNNGKNISRYTINGVVQTSEPPYIVINKMLKACNGRLPFRQGKYFLDIFSPREVCGTINDNQILTGGWSYAPYLKATQEFSKVRPEFKDLSPSGLGQLSEAPTITINLPNSKTTNIHNPNLEYVIDPDRARKIASVDANLQKIPKTFTFPTNLTGFKYESGDVVNIYSKRYNVLNEKYHIDEVELSQTDNLVRLSVSQFSNDTFVEADDVTVREFRPQPLVISRPNISGGSGPGGPGPRTTTGGQQPFG